jgi:hypothetical protein
MQNNPVYLYPNQIDVYTNISNSWTVEGYRKVYNRKLKIFKGVDNKLDFTVRNRDQKSLNIAGASVVFNLIAREQKDLIISKDCIISDATKGRIYVNLTDLETRDLESGFYSYSLVKENRQPINDNEYTVTSKIPLYIDSQFETISTIEILGDVYGEAVTSLEITKFDYQNPATTGYEDPAYYISSLIPAQANLSTANTLHTFQFYQTNYSGSVTIQGSLSDSSTPKTWTDITDVDLSQSSYKNITGKWYWLRVKHVPTAGTIDKILYR